jgi:hypothetical protein
MRHWRKLSRRKSREPETPPLPKSLERAFQELDLSTNEASPAECKHGSNNGEDKEGR